MVTGSPAAMRCATRGSEAGASFSPFEGRHGTRVRMSLASCAALLAASRALVARPFFGAGVSDFTAAMGEVCARAGPVEGNPHIITAAMATTETKQLKFINVE